MKMFLLICAAAAALAPAQTKPAPAKPAPAKPAPARAAPPAIPFEQRVESFWKAWASGDPKEIAAWYAPDAVVFDIGPLEHRGWAQFRRRVDESKAGAVSIRLPEKVAVRQSGEAVVTWNTLAIEVQGRKYEARHTLVWQKRGEAWKIVHEHLSIPTSSEE